MPLGESTTGLQVFTQRERLILRLIAEGYRNREIADELSISEKTVKMDENNLKRKLKARNRSSVISCAFEIGLVSLYEVLESRFSKTRPRAN
jgi:DNA-binding NarL/FixJ family response regulator